MAILGLTIDFMDAVKGVTRLISYERMEQCSTCKGTGSRDSGWARCHECKGSGTISIRKGMYMFTSTCSSCHGSGKVMRNPCPSCNGKGSTQKLMHHNLNIPKGVDNGSVLRVPRMGHGIGDLLVELSVGSHKYFIRKGYDIHTDKFITDSQAISGASIDVLTLHGKQKIQVKPGTAHDSVYKIAGFGIQKLYPNERFKGDHYVHFKIKIPSYLNYNQKEALKAYAILEEPLTNDELNI